MPALNKASFHERMYLMMNQEIEREFKNLLTKDEFEQLLLDLQLEEKDAIKQTNIYFDTEDFRLKEMRMGLRIRQYEDRGELTLKSPLQQNEKLETTDFLTFEQAEELVKAGHILLDGHVADHLRAAGVDPTTLVPIGQLSTLRYAFPGEGGVFFLDKSFYQDQLDYELEFEADELAEGAKTFAGFLDEHGIKIRKTAQKIERMLSYPNQGEV